MYFGLSDLWLQSCSFKNSSSATELEQCIIAWEVSMAVYVNTESEVLTQVNWAECSVFMFVPLSSFAVQRNWV